MTLQEEVAWCEGIWNMLKPGGVWAIPRSGLIFKKDAVSASFVLIERMPHIEGMPVTPEQLREIQDGDLLATRERFALMGVKVPDAT